MNKPQASWFLGDVAAIGRENKYTFSLPSPEVLARVVVGDTVKLMFEIHEPGEDEPGAERMWVEVSSRAGMRCTGKLANVPRVIKDLQPGDEVEFDLDVHVLDTPYRDEGESARRIEKYLVRCFTTRMVLHEHKPVTFLYREEPLPLDEGEEEAKRDSGWRLMCGEESEAYMDQDENQCYVSLGAVLRVDDSFVDLLEHPVGASFERDPQSGRFVPSDR